MPLIPPAAFISFTARFAPFVADSPNEASEPVLGAMVPILITSPLEAAPALPDEAELVLPAEAELALPAEDAPADPLPVVVAEELLPQAVSAKATAAAVKTLITFFLICVPSLNSVFYVCIDTDDRI
jgi:hypothetical protein